MVKVTVTSRFLAMNSHANHGFRLVVMSQCSAKVFRPWFSTITSKEKGRLWAHFTLSSLILLMLSFRRLLPHHVTKLPVCHFMYYSFRLFFFFNWLLREAGYHSSLCLFFVCLDKWWVVNNTYFSSIATTVTCILIPVTMRRGKMLWKDSERAFRTCTQYVSHFYRHLCLTAYI